MNDLHAHVETDARDCDGRYSQGYVLEKTTLERADDLGDYSFKTRVLAGVVSIHGSGTLSVTPDGLSWHEDTDEGYHRAEVRWCEDECEDCTWQRDHTAEREGY